MKIATSRVLEGNRIAAQIKAESAQQVRELAAAGIRPGLAVVLAGHDPASEIYVRSKVKACQELGIYSAELKPPESAGTEELVSIVQALNQRDDIDGILVQLPLPPQVD
ncbi:MAG: tetrahydrofolate dehydrogenase/cyclohydrolase catalytic domain-containing protein, partial [Candidatus Angelobacter sp.]